MSSVPLPSVYDEPLSPSCLAASYQRLSRLSPPYFTATVAPSPSFQQCEIDEPIDDMGWPHRPATTDSAVSGTSSLSPISEPASFFFPNLPIPPPPSSQSRSLTTPAHSLVSTATSPSRKRRKKRRMMDREQRLERRRAQHREVDAVRRSKESDAINQLHRLVQEEQQQQQQQGESEEQAANVKADDKCRKVRRLNILEASVALIERMKAAADMNNAQLSSHPRIDNAVATVSTDIPATFEDPTAFTYPSLLSSRSRQSEHISLGTTASQQRHHSSSFAYLSIAPPTPSYIACPDRYAALYQPGPASFSSSLCVVVISSLGVIVDVNERFLTCTGWRRSDLLDTLVNTRHITDRRRRLSPLLFQQHQQQLSSEWDGDSRTPAQAEALSQYPSFVTNVQALLRGEQSKVSGPWRCWTRDGRQLECQSTLWGEHDERREEQEEEIHQPRPPDRVVAVCSDKDVITVDSTKLCTISDDWSKKLTEIYNSMYYMHHRSDTSIDIQNITIQRPSTTRQTSIIERLYTALSQLTARLITHSHPTPCRTPHPPHTIYQ